MGLESGRYIIRSRVEGQPFANRGTHEDRSLNPKPVYCPNGDGTEGVWEIEWLREDRYRLRIGGAPVAPLDHQLFAILDDGFPPEEWVIRPSLHQGKNIYTILGDSGEGWVLTNPEPDSPIAVRYLIVFPTWPPTYPPNELWEIVPARD